MATSIDFYFDFLSPYSYLANAVLPRLAARHEASIDYRPFCLLDLMKIVGNRPTTFECRNKGVYAMADLQRWAKGYRAPFAPNPFWPSIDFAELGRGAFVAIDDGRGGEYVDAVYAAVFGEPRDLSQRSELLGTLDKAGFDGCRLLERAGSADYVVRLDEVHQGCGRARRLRFADDVRRRGDVLRQRPPRLPDRGRSLGSGFDGRFIRAKPRSGLIARPPAVQPSGEACGLIPRATRSPGTTPPAPPRSPWPRTRSVASAPRSTNGCAAPPARVIHNAGRRSVFSTPFITGGESHGAGDRFAGWPVPGAASYPYSAAFFISG